MRVNARIAPSLPHTMPLHLTNSLSSLFPRLISISLWGFVPETFITVTQIGQQGLASGNQVAL